MRAVQRLAVLGDSMTALAVARDAACHGMDVHLLATGGGVADYTRTARVHLLDSADPDGAALDLLVTLAREKCSALLATADDWLRFLIRWRPELDAAFHTVLHPSNQSIEICLDKARFAAWCVRHGFRTPRTAHGPTGVRGLSFPVMVRPAMPRRASGDPTLPKAAEAQDPAALEALVAKCSAAGGSAVVSESLLDGPVVQYSVGCARSVHGLQCCVARKVRPSPAACSVGTYVELTPFPPAEQLARSALDALDYYGMAEAEVLYREDRDKCYLIEINARPWLEYAMIPASGRDFLGMLLDPEWYPERPPRDVGVRWIDAGSDVLARVRRKDGADGDGDGWLRYARSVLRANSFGTFDWSDPGPTLQRVHETLTRWWHRHRSSAPAR